MSLGLLLLVLSMLLHSAPFADHSVLPVAFVMFLYAPSCLFPGGNAVGCFF